MGRLKASPRYEVVSMRVTSEEREAIIDKASRCKMSVADMLREAAQQSGLFNRRNHEAE